MATISLKGYFEPTPKNIRKGADALLAGALYLQADPNLLGPEWSRYIMLAVGLLKILSNFFTTTPTDEATS